MIDISAPSNNMVSFLVVDLFYSLGLLNSLSWGMILPIPMLLPWAEIDYHLHRGSILLVYSFHT